MESAGKGERLLKVQMGAVMTYCGWGASSWSGGAGFKEWSSPEAGAVQVRAASALARSLHRGPPRGSLYCCPAVECSDAGHAL